MSVLAPKATFFFECERWGWTETHYLVPPRSLDELTRLSLDLAADRAELLGNLAELRWIRLSLFGDRTDSQILGPFRLSTFIDTPPNSFFPWACYIVRANGQTVPEMHQKEWFLAGAPKPSAFAANPRFAAEWNRRFDDFIGTLTENRWGWLAQQRDYELFKPVKIIAIENLGAGLKVFAPNHGFAQDDTVQISYTRGVLGNINGKHTIFAVLSPDTFILPNNNADYRNTTPGWATRLAYAVIPYGKIELGPETSYPRGGPFRPVSWDLPSEPKFPLCPCGQIVDLLRSCYTAPVYFSDQLPSPILRRWYFVRNSAPPAPYSIFGSSVWHDDRIPRAQAGESRFAHDWNNGANRGNLRGLCNVGIPRFWEEGLTADEQQNLRVDYPPCCLPGKVNRGFAAAGRGRQWYTPPPPLRYGMALASKAKQGLTVAKIPQLGVALGRVGKQGVGEAKIPALGVATGGSGPQSIGEAKIPRLGVALGKGLQPQSGSGSGSGSGLGTVPTLCCGTLPAILHAAMSGSVGCGCFNGLYEIVWDGTAWRASWPLCGHTSDLVDYTIRLVPCYNSDLSTFQLFLAITVDGVNNLGGFFCDGSQSTCDPLYLHFTTEWGGSGSPCSGTVTVIVTE